MDGHEEKVLTPGQALREAIAESLLVVPGVPNALTACLAERMGFDAVYLSGAVLSAGVLAVPDVGLFTLTELLQQTGYLTRACALPVIVDADTGFGEALNVARTVEELEAVGAAAVQIEDQVLPKRCGHLSGKSLVDTENMCHKIRAAVSARFGDDLVLIARTDARGVEGPDAALQRAQRYVEAGADWIFAEALETREEFARFAEEIDVPLVANMTEFGRSPLLGQEELAEIGVAAVLYPVTIFRVAMRGMEAALATLQHDGSQHALLDVMQTREELYDLLEYDEFEDLDRQWSGEDS